jgi:EmrB/QacA subfamily drug resistance transporter
MALTDDSRQLRVILAASMGLFAIQLDFFSMQAALPQMSVDLDTSINSLQWVISGYMLSLAAFFIAGGRLADIFGRRRWLVIGAVVFGLASFAAGAAPNAGIVVAMRIIQGVGAAVLFTVSIAVVTNSFESAKVQRAVGLVFGISALGEALGPLFGGFFTEVISWRWVLWVNVPVCAAIVALVITSVDESRDETVVGVDWVGFALIVTSIAAFTYGIDRGPSWGWGSPLTLSFVVGGIALLGLFVWTETKVREPLVDLGFFRNREFTVMVVAGTAGNAAIVVAIFISMIYLQTERGFSPLEAGFAFLAYSAGVAIASQLSGRLERFESWLVMVCALAVGGLGTIGMGVTVDRSVPFFVLSVLSGFGLGLTFSYASVVTQSVVDPDKAGAASGVVMTVLVGVGGVFVAASSAAANTAVMEGPGAQLDDVITAILVVVGAIAVICIPLVIAMGRPSGPRDPVATSVGGRLAVRHEEVPTAP